MHNVHPWFRGPVTGAVLPGDYQRGFEVLPMRRPLWLRVGLRLCELIGSAVAGGVLLIALFGTVLHHG